MTEYDIKLALMRDCFRRHLMCPNYTPKNWWECDVFEATKAGYFIEYEIKLTKSDFKADAKKSIRRMVLIGNEYTQDDRNKHDLLSKGDTRGPNRFYYVVPKGLLSVDEVPSWAGLIVCDKSLNPNARYKAVLSTVKDAPKLHREKLNPKVLEHVRGIFYYRFMEHYIYRSVPPQEPIDHLAPPPEVDLTPEPVVA